MLQLFHCGDMKRFLSQNSSAQTMRLQLVLTVQISIYEGLENDTVEVATLFREPCVTQEEAKCTLFSTSTNFLKDCTKFQCCGRALLAETKQTRIRIRGCCLPHMHYHAPVEQPVHLQQSNSRRVASQSRCLQRCQVNKKDRKLLVW